MRLKSYLDLVRVFLTPSAVADSLAGFALLRVGTDGDMLDIRLVALAGTSIALYWFGMASNDLFDLTKDRVNAPAKPLPSGRLSRTAGITVSIALAVASLLLGHLSGALEVAACVLVLAALYNAGGKRIPIVGNVLMGSCRSGNLLLGAVSAAGLTEALEMPATLWAAGSLGIYVTGVTAISVLEDHEYRASLFHAIATPLLLIPLLLAAMNPGSSGGWINCIILLWLLLRTQRLAASRRIPVHPAAVYVRGALGGIFFVDAGVLWAFSGAGERALTVVLALYALFVFGWWLKCRWLQSGGSDT